jgi:hypothetical protein
MSTRRKTKSQRRNQRTKFTGRKATSTTMTSVMGGFPDRARVRLRYVTNVQQTPVSVTAADYVFSGNGMFDPDVTSTGGQPANFDDWSAIYLRYRVWKSTFKWCIANNATGALDMSSYVVGPRHTSTAVNTRASQENFQSTPYTRYAKTIIYRNGCPEMSGSMTMSTQKFFGLTQAEFEGNEDACALVTANPSHQWFWHLSLSADDQGSTIVHYINYVVEYDVEFWDRVDTTLDSRIDRMKLLRQMKAEEDEKGGMPGSPINEPGWLSADSQDDSKGATKVATPSRRGRSPRRSDKKSA